jgi:hypothetical protein
LFSKVLSDSIWEIRLSRFSRFGGRQWRGSFSILQAIESIERWGALGGLWYPHTSTIRPCERESSAEVRGYQLRSRDIAEFQGLRWETLFSCSSALSFASHTTSTYVLYSPCPHAPRFLCFYRMTTAIYHLPSTIHHLRPIVSSPLRPISHL